MRWEGILRFKSIGVVLALVVIVAIPMGYVAAGEIQCRSHNIIAVTDTGPVVGLRTDTMNEFLGIPYAAPPVGDLRWQPPQRAERWHGLRDATAFANHCPQFTTPFGVQSFTEDCLYLNVYTPKEHKWWHMGHGRPVMVWFHGGAGFLGESDDYDPTKLVENEEVIVVTINYRLGFLGFLAHPALSAEADYQGSGDYGWMDQQAALEWVQRNIRHFGGNPHNVTIFGESFGGLSVHAQLASPEAAGLFDRAIVQSGAYFLNTTPLAAAEAVGTAKATAMGCPGNDAAAAACLRSLPVETLLANQGSGGFTGNIDYKVLMEPIGATLASGDFNQVPVMEGSNHDEWRLFVALSFELVPPYIPTSSANYAARISASFGGALPAPVVAYLANVLYPLPSPPTPPGPSIALGAVGTDGIFACNSRTSIRRMASFVPVFAYEFNDQNAPQLNLPPNVVSGMPYGAAHASELQYIFGLRPVVPAPPLTDDQVALSDTMVSYWGHFARFGDPNSRHTPDWPQYDPAADVFQSLIPPTPVTEATFALDHKCGFWSP
ncbi:MAG: carboxylesterase family protein [Deltaproteobacteria bacterium]|nr:carboxylesterase family protein [Deltaproteobacteria bacterium]